MATRKKFFTVWVGRVPGVYTSKKKFEEQIDGFDKPIFKHFWTREEADKAFDSEWEEILNVSRFDEFFLDHIGLPEEESICVRGAHNKKTDALGYQALHFPTEERLFFIAPLVGGNNYIAEFLAIVSALACCKNRGLSSTIYTESIVAMRWVKEQKATTRHIPITEATGKLRATVGNAQGWLKKNTPFANKVEKWETLVWGENPASFSKNRPQPVH